MEIHNLQYFKSTEYSISWLGIGGTTVYVIGAPYLDDSIDKKDSPLYFGMGGRRKLTFTLLIWNYLFIYLAITIAVRMIGPVFGYFLSSACLKLYVEITKKPSTKFRCIILYIYVAIL